MNTESLVLKKMAEFKAKLRLMSKNDLIRSYTAQYAQTVKYAVMLEQANEKISILEKQNGNTAEKKEQ